MPAIAWALGCPVEYPYELNYGLRAACELDAARRLDRLLVEDEQTRFRAPECSSRLADGSRAALRPRTRVPTYSFSRARRQPAMTVRAFLEEPRARQKRTTSPSYAPDAHSAQNSEAGTQ